uniref:Alkylated DNA repair dioxygenase n=1 Tax=Pithovirus LCDPAC02 TaxID=2506601 RepID=A0A481YNM5_9VIRU|nr:MAG: alkylated DNA repair dioxygenase [Pithovirus LCDPAC02]
MDFIFKPVRCYTTFKENIISTNFATDLYEYLRDNITWEDGIKSRKGFTRKAKSLSMCDNPRIDSVIITALHELIKQEYAVLGIYLNYYRNGEMWTPNHSHKGTHQLVISLGATRTLNIAKKSYEMTNGSAIIFGSSTHGVPKDKSINGRISIATFMKPIKISYIQSRSDEELAHKLQLEKWSN